ncbi:MAG TPA: hypothetical protein VGQ18_13610 [Gemmatimonadales bacterium]|jgi:hypothetical protein|nr:hypothetical protein [Gemmatimonadales bacterium]
MKAIRVLMVALVVCVIASCSDRAPTAPVSAPAPNASLLGDLLKPTGLLQCSALPAASVTQTIGSAGGTITVGPHTLRIPAGALDQPTTITASLDNNRGVNGIRFAPEGLKFDTPAYLTMSYANCNVLGSLLPKRIAYTSDLLDIVEYLLSIDNLFTKKVTGRVPHFSEYVIAW